MVLQWVCLGSGQGEYRAKLGLHFEGFDRKASQKESSIINYTCNFYICEFLQVLLIQTSGKFLAVRRVLLILWLHRLLCHRNMRKQFWWFVFEVATVMWGVKKEQQNISFHINENSCRKLMNVQIGGYD